MMTRAWTEVLRPATPYYPNSSWCLGEKRSGHWSPSENKLFEDALAQFDRDTPDRWEKVAAKIPGKSIVDIITHYKDLEDDVSHIEAGVFPFPAGYTSSSGGFTLDWESDHGFEGLKQPYGMGAKRAGSRSSDQERKKGVPWTEEEHKLFLMGLERYGKGDWRNISRNFVMTRTPTQVASHAQKFFIRKNSGGKDKRRSSIHDITTVSLPSNNGPPSPSPSPSQSTHEVSLQSSLSSAVPGAATVAPDVVHFSVTAAADSRNEEDGHVLFDAFNVDGNPYKQQTPYGAIMTLRAHQISPPRGSTLLPPRVDVGDHIKLLFPMHRPHG